MEDRLLPLKQKVAALSIRGQRSLCVDSATHERGCSSCATRQLWGRLESGADGSLARAIVPQVPRDPSESAQRRREEDHRRAGAAEPGQPADRDDALTLLFLCCHPSLSVPSQLALTLRAVSGLMTAEIASAFLVPEATMAQRISRAKQSIKSSGTRSDLPPK